MSSNSILQSIHDPAIMKPLADALGKHVLKQPLAIMHVCGTHEHAIAKAGIRSILPEGLRLIAGPGCPVCVCPSHDIDLAIGAAMRDGVILTTFGDMFRVPSINSSLEMVKAKGRAVRVVYSPMDAVRIARDNPFKEVIFVAVGFETTAGPIAATLAADPPRNFTIIPSLRLIPPALTFLLERAGSALNGFILPGHVSTVLGRRGYLFLETGYGMPGVIAGFEPLDILRAIIDLVNQAENGMPARVVNLYKRVVTENGNRKARESIYRVFEPVDASWRGIGVIPESGLSLRSEFEHLDAVRKLGLEPFAESVDVMPGCICHLVILGDAEPEECPLFGTVCTPRKPTGPCMVSSEGTCRARYQYRRV